MQANLTKMGFGLLYSLAAAVVFLVLLPGSPAVAGEGEAFIFLPGEAPRYGGQQGREADITELLATNEQTGGVVAIFRQTIAPNSGPPRHTCTEWKLNSVTSSAVSSASNWANVL